MEAVCVSDAIVEAGKQGRWTRLSAQWCVVGAGWPCVPPRQGKELY